MGNWFNAEMPIDEVPLLSPCAPAAPAPAMLSKIPGYNATRNTKLSPNVIGDPGMQMPTCQLAYMPTCLHANLLNSPNLKFSAKPKKISQIQNFRQT